MVTVHQPIWKLAVIYEFSLDLRRNYWRNFVEALLMHSFHSQFVSRRILFRSATRNGRTVAFGKLKSSIAFQYCNFVIASPPRWHERFLWNKIEKKILSGPTCVLTKMVLIRQTVPIFIYLVIGSPFMLAKGILSPAHKQFSHDLVD